MHFPNTLMVISLRNQIKDFDSTISVPFIMCVSETSNHNTRLYFTLTEQRLSNDKYVYDSLKNQQKILF